MLKNKCRKIALAGFILGDIFLIYGIYVVYQITVGAGFGMGEFWSEMWIIVVESLVLYFPAMILWFKNFQSGCRDWFWAYPAILALIIASPFIFKDALANGMTMLFLGFPVVIIFGIYFLVRK